MGYGASKSGNYDGFSIAALAPGIYKGASLDKVELTKATKADGTEGKSIIVFHFNTPEGPHQHTEWDVLDSDSGDVEKKRDNVVKRIEHILHQFVPANVIESNIATSFEQLGQWAITVLNGKTAGVKDLELKIIGNVYNGRATSGFPNYVGFIARASRPTYKPLSFSPREVAANKEYNDFNNSTPDADAATSGTPSAPGLPGSANIDPDF